MRFTAICAGGSATIGVSYVNKHGHACERFECILELFHFILKSDNKPNKLRHRRRGHSLEMRQAAFLCGKSRKIAAQSEH